MPSYNLVLLAIAAILAIEIPRPRQGERFRLKEVGACRRGTHTLTCVVRNISESGALLQGVLDFEPGDEFELEVRSIGTLPARVVRQSRRGAAVQFGCLSKKQRGRLVNFIYCSGLNNGVAPPTVRAVVSGFFGHLFRR